MKIKIERVWVRMLSRRAFKYSATWMVDGAQRTDPPTTLTFPPEALWATEERLIEMMSEGARIGLSRWAREQPAPSSFEQPAELGAVNVWDGTVELSEP
jgi:hypothetical protein